MAKKHGGRPPLADETVDILIRMPVALVRRIEASSNRNLDNGRSEAIRRLLEAAIDAEKRRAGR